MFNFLDISQIYFFLIFLRSFLKLCVFKKNILNYNTYYVRLYLLETLRRLKLLTGLRSANPPLILSDLLEDESATILTDSFVSVTKFSRKILIIILFRLLIISE